MRITDLLDKRSISLNETPKTKSEALDRIIDLMVASGKINDREAYREQVYAREEESTTGIGEGIAIPHGKCDAVTKPGLAAMVVKDGVEFDALDGQPVTLMFLIAAPNTKDNVHLDVLSKLSVLMMDEVFADALRNAKSADEFLDIIDKADAEQGDIDEFAELLNQHWKLSCMLDAGTTNTCIDQILLVCEDLVDGKFISGAGGGGFIQVILKKDVTKEQLHERLHGVFQDSGVDVWDCELLV